MRVKGAFRSPPPTFRPDSEKTWDSCRITLHTPPAFPASSAPENPRRPPLWGKKGAFSPASPAETRFFCPPPAIFPPEVASFPRRNPARARQPAVFRPKPRRNPPAKPRPKPRLGRARRQPRQSAARTPPPRHTRWLGKPDCRGRLSRFAVEKCAPQGGIRSLGMTGKRPPPPLA